jgi:23S rRNA pseudouridine1911/1915/1917 synthase
LDEGTIEAPIGRSSRDPRRFAVSPLAAKEAKTTFAVLERFGEAGTHQVRVHLAYLGHPVLGDATYGSSSDVVARPALHAHTLAFDHPASGERMRFLSPLPADIIEACGRLREQTGRSGGAP